MKIIAYIIIAYLFTLSSIKIHGCIISPNQATATYFNVNIYILIFIIFLGGNKKDVLKTRSNYYLTLLKLILHIILIETNKSYNFRII